MARYIDADKLITALCDCTEDTWGKGLGASWWAQSVKLKDNMVECINNQPTADVVEVRHSRWENISGFDVCNICGASPAYCEPKPNNPKGYPPYCHYCGAKMDGGKAE